MAVCSAQRVNHNNFRPSIVYCHAQLSMRRNNRRVTRLYRRISRGQAHQLLPGSAIPIMFTQRVMAFTEPWTEDPKDHGIEGQEAPIKWKVALKPR